VIRREFIAGLGTAAIWPLAARAAQGATPKRIGFLGGGSKSGTQSSLDCFMGGLRELGWIEGENIKTEFWWTEGIAEQTAKMAADVVRQKPDLIVTTSTPPTLAAKLATNNIPVVFIAVSDPVASGIVPSLARPDANLTGVSNFLPATSAKLLELAASFAPSISRVGVLLNASNPGKTLELDELKIAAQTLRVGLEVLDVRSTEDFDAAFSKSSKSGCDALLTLLDGLTLANRTRIIGYAESRKLPAVYPVREFVDAGGLMSYGLNFCRHFHRAATYVDKILKGARPSDLPVELPTEFELVINLKAARTLGMTVPPTMLARADQVIE
jgi:putative ABC transport system substrate-binding protein